MAAGGSRLTMRPMIGSTFVAGSAICAARRSRCFPAFRCPIRITASSLAVNRCSVISTKTVPGKMRRRLSKTPIGSRTPLRFAAGFDAWILHGLRSRGFAQRSQPCNTGWRKARCSSVAVGGWPGPPSIPSCRCVGRYVCEASHNFLPAPTILAWKTQAGVPYSERDRNSTPWMRNWSN
jgi:hypothetical protein